MTLDTSDNGLLAIDRFPINLQRTEQDDSLRAMLNMAADSDANFKSDLTVQTPLG